MAMSFIQANEPSQQEILVNLQGIGSNRFYPIGLKKQIKQQQNGF